MSELVVVTYPDVYKAGEVCAALQRLHEDLLIEIEDVAYITREANGKVKLHETVSVMATSTRTGLVTGTIWGGLVGLLFLNPVLGMVAGGAVGAACAATGKLADYGIPESFMKDIGEKVALGKSALFILFRKSNWERVLDRIAQFGGAVMHTSLSPEAEAKLEAALAEGGQPRAA